MKTVRVVMMSMWVIMWALGWPLGVITAEAQDTSHVNVIEALKDGIITLTIGGGENTVTITVNQVDEAKEDLTLFVSKGLTKFGFIANDTISTGGTGWSVTFSSGSGELKLFATVTTMDFESDGFSLELNEEALLPLPKNKDEFSISVAGNLKVDVPYTFSGFELAGISGKITEGEILIQRDDEDNKKFKIRYGNMKITQ